jgi:hypothetical protein
MCLGGASVPTAPVIPPPPDPAQKKDQLAFTSPDALLNRKSGFGAFRNDLTIPQASPLVANGLTIPL